MYIITLVRYTPRPTDSCPIWRGLALSLKRRWVPGMGSPAALRLYSYSSKAFRLLTAKGLHHAYSSGKSASACKLFVRMPAKVTGLQVCLHSNNCHLLVAGGMYASMLFKAGLLKHIASPGWLFNDSWLPVWRLCCSVRNRSNSCLIRGAEGRVRWCPSGNLWRRLVSAKR